MKALLNNDPQIGYVVIWMQYKAGDDSQIQLAFESMDEYCSRNLMARPSKLIRWAWMLWWKGFFRRIKYGKQPKPSFHTVKDELQR